VNARPHIRFPAFDRRLRKLRGAIVARFGDELKFLRTMIDEPRSVGAILPTGPGVARQMAGVADVGSALRVLELGPGTGVITRAILARGIAPERLVCVEYSPDFARHIRLAFPSVDVIEGDAFDLAATLGPAANETFDCVVSALPLLNFSLEQRTALINDLLNRIPAGRPIVQFSYGPKPPVAARHGQFSVERHAVVLKNVPPAQIWIYRKAPGAA
jgi:phosphatidylethanolamine/phosphatidyl-N-methylethanolamine N-methyltransferase